MKTFLTILLLIPINVSADKIREKCAKMADSAKTDRGWTAMYNICVEELNNPQSSTFNRSDEFKCAKKAYKKKTTKAVVASYNLCIEKNK